jgi:hypothetical protein
MLSLPFGPRTILIEPTQPTAHVHSRIMQEVTNGIYYIKKRTLYYINMFISSLYTYSLHSDCFVIIIFPYENIVTELEEVDLCSWVRHIRCIML